MNGFTKAVGAIVLALGLVVALTLLRGVVLASLWGWFIVPLGVPALGLAHAIGVSIIVSVFMYGVATEKPSGEIEGWLAVVFATVKALAMYLFAWGMGAIVHGFM